MDADVMIKANDRLNCFLHCDRASMKETLSPWGLQRVILCPKGWILTGWNVYQPDGQRILYQDLSAFIRVHPVKRSFVTMMDTDEGIHLFS